jgi:hypothetical protein
MATDGRTVALWVLAGIAALLLLASFTGTGTGMFGWGFMMGFMWLFILLPLLLIVILVLIFANRPSGDAQSPPGSEGPRYQRGQVHNRSLGPMF